MAMTDGYNGMTSVKVEIFGSLVVPHIATFAFYNVEGEEGIYVKEIHFLMVFYLFNSMSMALINSFDCGYSLDNISKSYQRKSS
jgi:hypothetical protein